MLGKKAKKRAIFLALILLLSVVTIFLIFKSLEENIVYFFTPSEIYNKQNISFNKTIRVGGLVKMDSIIKEQKFCEVYYY